MSERAQRRRDRVKATLQNPPPARVDPRIVEAMAAHRFFVNMRDMGCTCGLRFHGVTVGEARLQHAEHIARQEPTS